MNLKETRRRVDQARMLYLAAARNVTKEKCHLAECRKRLGHIESAISVAQQTAKELQQRAHQQIASVVGLCLQTVFGSGYDFKIEFQEKRGRTEAKLLLIRDGHVLDDPVYEDSGGVLDVASFALRISALLLHKPPLRRILIMDEPFKSLSVEYRESVKQLLERLSNDFKIQIIMATHMEELKVGQIIQLERES